ncbi:MAG: Fic family protein [Methylacidiphilales bacterium]|nr:Fic family protein [Candidatus Methylacidiphilales bacterium]
MPKIITESDLLPVLEVFRNVLDPISIEQAEALLSGQVPRRTLQRRLAALVKQGRLSPQGQQRGRRYRLNEISSGLTVKEQPAEIKRSELPLSSAASNIFRSIMRPLSNRRPIGYQASFLEKYRPNASAYLLPEHLSRLAALGQATGAPQPAGTHFRKVLDRLLIDLSWNSSRLEGNTYSLLETERLLALGENAEGRNAKEAQMILNHKAAIELLAEQADEIGFNRYTLFNLHALLADNLLQNPNAAGRLRANPVGISGTVYHPLEQPQMIEDHFQLVLDKAAQIQNAFEQAFFVMVHIPYLQPFEDVNKRVSRLAANIPLVLRNLCPLSFVDVPKDDYVNGILGVYELNRVEYLRDVFLWAYERSCARYSAVCQSLGEPDMFRLKYRTQIRNVVAEVVRGGKNKTAAVKWIAGSADALIPAPDQPRFVEIVETELSSLHEGNIARYRLRPAEFQAWRETWR